MNGRPLTRDEREALRRLIDRARRPRLLVAAAPVDDGTVRCTRCRETVDRDDLCKGRPWCKRCEAARRKRCRDAAKTRKAAA